MPNISTQIKYFILTKYFHQLLYLDFMIVFKFEGIKGSNSSLNQSIEWQN